MNPVCAYQARGGNQTEIGAPRNKQPSSNSDGLTLAEPADWL